MKKPADYADLGEIIVVSKLFQLNTYQMVTLLENGVMEVFENKEAFLKKYGKKEVYDELDDWCELSTGKVFTKLK
ncbi:ABC-type protease/lipase transport system fused ATPase/permease subunit [Evansella vedderi]|uniref:ABC-type protease/lipase transport system fused ATPase/permease subunit n=1 Tax=Evansella vedderi TaxID=38282 RepID=A0ABU0A2N1_9BACI|nr:hypothetical protein [Evansella vedderi]MDQ0257745.1 ABC-type protease/lipase transport system fused ATPase/permease subunit [Evansella vedderi]